MKRSTILRKAAAELWDGVGKREGVSEYICCTPIFQRKREAYDIRKRISERIDYKYSVFVWLYIRGYTDCSTPMHRIQAYRKAWCLHLADEYKSKGD